MKRNPSLYLPLVAGTLALTATAVVPMTRPAGAEGDAARAASASTTTSTPIQHPVVVFQENVSFDHYFGTYPDAANRAGETAFTVSGQAHGVGATATPGTSSLVGETENGTIIGDPQPLGDDCSTRDQVQMTGRNVGDLLNGQGVTWGWFEGGFRPTTPYDPSTAGKAVCGSSHPVGAALGGTGSTGAKPWGIKGDYIPHHEPFQYYASTANPHHLPPTSTAAIGTTDRANHQYDLVDFWAAADSGHLPAVSFLKAAGYQDGYAGYSDPIDEQQFLVDTINHLQRLDAWKSTAVVISYDDSDGWYDHQMSPIVNQSQAASDQLSGAARCGSKTDTVTGGYQDRCGYGPRLPLLVISPFSRTNCVDHAIADQTSVLRFIEDNWGLGRIGDASFDARAGSLDNMFEFSHPRAGQTGKLVLDPRSGVPVRHGRD